MQPNIAPAHAPKPARPDQEITPVAPVERPRRSLTWGWIVLVVLIAAGAWYWRKAASDVAATKQTAAQASVRSAKIAGGKIASSVRLTGTTGPEKFATIMGPQMRGSRTFMGGGGAFMGRGGGSRGGGSSGGGGGGESSSRSSSGGGSSSGGVSSSSSSASAAGRGGGSGGSSSAASAGFGSTGGGASVGGVRDSSSALRNSTTRSSSSGGRSGGSRSSGSGAAMAAITSMGSEGLGSTSGSLYGGGGPGGSSGGPGGPGGSGGGDFGSILQELAKPGSMVKKGDRIAEFDRQYMLQRLDDYKAGVTQQELNMRRLQADLEVTRKSHEQSILIAKGEVEKAKLDLKTIPVRSAIDSERFRLALEETEARYQQLLKEVPFVREGEESQIRNSELDLRQSKLEHRRAEGNAERMVVKTAIDGMVVMLQMFRGGDFGQVQAGDPVAAGMPFLQIVDPSSMVINAAVNQVDVERIRVGAKARVRFDAFPDLELAAHVYSIAAMPRSSRSSARASFLKELPVRIKLDQMDPRVIPDLSVSVDVILEEEEAAAVAPLSSVFRDEAGKEAFVYVQGPKGWDKRPVQLGIASNSHVVIRNGLRAGDVVAEAKPPEPGVGSSS